MSAGLVQFALQRNEHLELRQRRNAVGRRPLLLAGAIGLLVAWFWGVAVYGRERAAGTEGAFSAFFAVSFLAVCGIASSTAGLLYLKVLFK